MSFFGNIIWLIFGGFLSGMLYMLSGLILCITILGIPFGVQAMKLGVATLTPFGKILKSSENTGFFKLIFDILWLIFFGWEIALSHLLFGALLFVTILGIPFAYQHFKLIPIALFPFNYKLE